MKIIQHRRNTINQLLETDNEFGVEIDIRSYSGKLILQHDPFSRGVLLEEWIKYYNHNFLIINTKEEGIETKILEIMIKNEIKEFFFLDQTFPFLLKMAKSGESRCAVRVSNYESIKTAISLTGLVDWIWIDLFNTFSAPFIDIGKIGMPDLIAIMKQPFLNGFNFVLKDLVPSG